MQKLLKIQSELKAPKNQRNNFGNYNYRSCEDILEAVKPLCSEQGLVLTVSDDVVMVGERIYVKAIATVLDLDTSCEVSVSAFAREPKDQKGMNEAQITGSASSYARKYALNGLFLIDDTKDADFTNTHGKDTKKTYVKPIVTQKEYSEPTTNVPAQTSGIPVGVGSPKQRALVEKHINEGNKNGIIVEAIVDYQSLQEAIKQVFGG